MRILWIGDAADSGFGSVTREVGKRLLAHHDVRFLLQNMAGYPADPAIADRAYNRDYFSPQQIAHTIKNGFGAWKPEQVVLLADFEAARALVASDPDAYETVPVWHHVPIEGTELPTMWARLWRVIHPVAITQFGAEQIRLVTGAPVPYIWHGVDHEAFYPVSAEHPIDGSDSEHKEPITLRSKRDCKEHFGLNPDGILLLTAERNMPRKNLPAMMRAVAPVLETHPNVQIIFHCRIDDFGGHLMDSKSKLSPKAQMGVGFTNGHDTWRGMGTTTLAALHNAADIYLNAGSEGFGLNLANSLACGVPVLGVDYSSVPEVVGDAGVLLPPGPLVDNIYDHRWASLDERAYTKALGVLVVDTARRAALGQKAITQASRFSWDHSASAFDTLFKTNPQGSVVGSDVVRHTERDAQAEAPLPAA